MGKAPVGVLLRQKVPLRLQRQLSEALTGLNITQVVNGHHGQLPFGIPLNTNQLGVHHCEQLAREFRQPPAEDSVSPPMSQMNHWLESQYDPVKHKRNVNQSKW